MIPHIIHYCWYGGQKKGRDVQRCIDSWKKYFPDYEIREWDENNTDIESNIFIKEAYENKKYAFVSDVVRLQVLFKYGGIYFDTDVEAVKDMRAYLQDMGMICGFESNDKLATCFLATSKENKIVEEILEYYNDKHFMKSDGSLDLTVNPVIWTAILCKHGLICDGRFQKLDTDIVVYPADYFSAYNGVCLSYEVTENTCCIHHCSASWLPTGEKKLLAVKRMVAKIIGGDKYNAIKHFLRRE